MTRWMLRAQLCRLVALTAVALVAPHAAQAVTGRVTVDIDGQKRSAFVVERERLKRAPRPTLIVLHGSNGTGRRIERELGLDEMVRGSGAVLVYPDALNGHWNFVPGTQKPDDVAFLRRLVGNLVSDGLTDPRRVFLIGVSSGGMMAMRTACEGGDLLAGVVSLIANMPAGLASTCKPTRSIAFASVLGTLDPLMPFKGGTATINDYKGEVVSADATLTPFASVANCGAQRVSHDLPDRDPTDSSRITIDRVSGCKVPVELIRVEGGGHTLPGRPPRTDRGVPLGPQNNDANTARIIWDFVRRVPR